MDWMPEAIREGIFTILFISGPLVILAAGLGLAVGILQAATQVQEQTLGSAVKVIGLLIALIVFGFYMFQYVSKYTAQSLQRAFQLVPSLGSYVLPRDNFLTKPKGEEQVTPQASPPTSLAKTGPNTSGATKLADAVSEPDVIQTNVPNSRPKATSSPARSPEPTRAQPLTPVTQINTPRTTQTRTTVVPAQQAPSRTQAPVTQAPQRQPVAAQPARTAPAAQPVRSTPVQPAPTQPVRSSISDRLNSIKNSAGDLQGAGQ